MLTSHRHKTAIPSTGVLLRCFYAASSPGLLQGVRALIDPLITRTNQLLKEWDEHPALLSFLTLYHGLPGIW